MEKYHDTVKALEHCSHDSGVHCIGCPYRNKTTKEKTCRQQLCLDAMHDLAVAMGQAQKASEECETMEMERNRLYTECNELREELKNRPEVGFDADTFDKTVEAVLHVDGCAEYWRGYADGLKWLMRELSFMGEKQEGGDDV